MLSFSLLLMSNQTAFVTYSPILSIAQQYYNVSSEKVLWFSYVWFFSYSLMSLFVIHPLQNRMWLMMVLASVLNAGGGWMRYWAQKNFILALVGESLIALAQIPLLAAPVYVADKWFPQHEKFISTNVLFNSVAIGLNLGFYVACIIVDTDKNKIPDLLLYSAIFLSIPVPLCIFSFRNKPTYEITP